MGTEPSVQSSLLQQSFGVGAQNLLDFSQSIFQRILAQLYTLNKKRNTFNENEAIFETLKCSIDIYIKIFTNKNESKHFKEK